jgi:tetratricopeptide (TPR) repeat protein
VTGNLTVTSHIICTGTDGGLGLVVLGNLCASNIAVGGQELYVRGNVAVTGVYCGSYNHGESIIDGDVSAGLLISDDYRFWIKGRLLAPTAATGCERIGLLESRDRDESIYFDDDVSGIGYGGARWVDGEVPISYALVEECIDSDDDSSFIYYALVDRIMAGEAVLKPDCDLGSPEVMVWRRANALYDAGQTAYYEDDDSERAVELFKQALAAGFAEKQCRYMLGLCLYQEDQYGEAIPNFTYCIEHDYERLESLVKRASSRLLSLTGDDDDSAHAAAWADCEEAIKTPSFSDDDDHFLAEAHNLKGYSLYLQHKYAEAIDPLAKSLNIESANCNANANMAKSLWHLDREPEALSYADRAIAIDPDNDFLYYVKAQCHYKAGDYNDAHQSFERYLESEPNDEQALIYTARSLVAMNRLDDARRSVIRLFESHPEQKTVNPDGFMAWALWLADREGEALPYAMRSVEIHPAPGYHLLIKGGCHVALGQVNAALADWNAYAHFAPNDLVVWIMAAETYLDVGEMKFAEQCIAIALSIDPEHADVRQLEREFKERQST